VRVEHGYPVAVEELVAVLVDPQFLRARGERFGGVGSASVQRAGDTVTVRAPRQIPLEHVPGPVQRFVGDGRVVQVDEWGPAAADGTVRGSWTVTSDGLPAEVSGGHEISPGAAGCHYLVTGTVRVHLPVIGGALARQLVGYLEELIAAEQAFAADWLADQTQ